MRAEVIILPLWIAQALPGRYPSCDSFWYYSDTLPPALWRGRGVPVSGYAANSAVFAYRNWAHPQSRHGTVIPYPQLPRIPLPLPTLYPGLRVDSDGLAQSLITDNWLLTTPCFIPPSAFA